MKALVVKEFGGPLILEDVPVPQPAADEALIRVKACAVDQFDLTIRDGKFAMAKKVPIILRHEIAGVVAAVGADVTSVSVGDRVTSTLYLTCGKCRYCLTGRETICADFKGYVGIHTSGAYAEYTTVPAANLVKVPESISLPDGSVLANAIGTPFHARVCVDHGGTAGGRPLAERQGNPRVSFGKSVPLWFVPEYFAGG
jgi:D-arabinose 1-dehydrogenase-like Zn-dependent alcohol dehydrogenase